MKRAYVAMVLDLSLPIADDPSVAAALGQGLVDAMRLLERSEARRLEVALAGAVTHTLLRYGEERALQMLAERAGAGQVAFLATACWGAFLPLVPAREAARQIELNTQVNREALGEWVYRTEGLFPPQLGYTRRLAELALARRLPRILCDELGWRGGTRALPRDRHFTLQGHDNFHVFFVDRGLSAAIADGRGLTDEHLQQSIAPRRPGYGIVRIPGRTLSGSAAGLQLIGALGGATKCLPALLEELLALFGESEAVEPLPSALGTDASEYASGVQFAKWSAPGNELQAILWRLAQLASEESHRLERSSRGPVAAPEPGRLRRLLDESLDSAAWRFASGKPEFDAGRVREGGRKLLEALRAGGDFVRPETRAEAEQLYARLEQRTREGSRLEA